MREEVGYMNDEELEALIAEVENGGMIAPPVYLKELIMNEAGFGGSGAGEVHGCRKLGAGEAHGCGELGAGEARGCGELGAGEALNCRELGAGEVHGCQESSAGEVHGCRESRAGEVLSCGEPGAGKVLNCWEPGVGKELPAPVKAERIRAAKRRFRCDSFKIAAAAAAAVFCLISMPAGLMAGGKAKEGGIAAENSRIERRIAKDADRYREEKQKAIAGREGIGSGIGEFLGNRSGFGIPERADRMFHGFSSWFGLEEKDYE